MKVPAVLIQANNYPASEDNITKGNPAQDTASAIDGYSPNATPSAIAGRIRLPDCEFSVFIS